jgi:hypothetical protein
MSTEPVSRLRPLVAAAPSDAGRVEAARAFFQARHRTALLVRVV